MEYVAKLGEWRDLRSIAMVETVRQIGEEATTTRRCFISSLVSNAKLMLQCAPIGAL